MRVGFMMAYNEVSWMRWAILHARRMCDRLIISEGSQFSSFPHIPERSNDGTLDVISDMSREYPGFIEVQPTERKHDNYRHNQCDNWNKALSSCREGDYFVPLDADIFYNDKGIEMVNGLMVDGVAACNVYGPLFAFSFDWQVSWTSAVYWQWTAFYKVLHGFHFIPTHKPAGAGSVEDVSGYVMWHYTWVKPRERVRMRMETSGMFDGMVEWFDKWYDAIELRDGFQCPSHEGGTLKIHSWEGKHPSILDDHPWRDGRDVR